MSVSPLLSVKNLRTFFKTESGEIEAVRGISYELSPGRTLGIVGESGSGKSVSSLSIMGLMAANGRFAADEIRFNPQGQAYRLDQMSEKEKRALRGNEMSMIFQEPMSSLNPVLSCGFQVAEALRLHKGLSKAEARAETLKLFEQVQLPRVKHIYEAYPHQISGGQKQRVMIAMAISCGPSLLIADEPTTALDVTVQGEILELLQRLQAHHGMAMIFITHDLGVVAEIADDLLVMYKGEIVERGSIEAIFRAPQHPYTQGLLACRPKLTQKLYRLPTIKDFITGEETDDTTKSKKLAEETPEKPSSVLLKVENIKTWFNTKKGFLRPKTEAVKAVDGVSFEVFRGETLGLVGESGCGKTTLGRSILRLIEPIGGAISYEGQDIRALDREALRGMRKKMQIIFQDPYSSLNPRMMVGRVIQEPMQVHGIGSSVKERKARVLSLLERVGLAEEHYERFPHEFSGGQRQRICIARALAVEPEFIICDESVSALDVSIQAQVLNLLKDLQDELDLTYIFISHDLSVVKFMSDRIMVMRAGKMVELQEAETLYRSPQSDYTQKLIQAIPAGTLASIEAAKERRANAQVKSE
ncbi:MAG: ABC transporter ATP-binding protein [Bacteroidota bacterium]